MSCDILVIEEAWKAYKDAKEASEKELPSTHPIRLGLALNYSVFLYEIKEDTKAACELAKSVSFLVYIILPFLAAKRSAACAIATVVEGIL